ncbi:hypothetical protein ABMA28_005520 [Loxostege sticticalis]|uniref:Uncharacterized protein n=1 Tax=Loxostege sticticalis TaxID=481309 RepID=A0ABD0SML9_LOXSC
MAEDEDVVPDTLEEAGALEADVGARFDQQLAAIDPRLKIDMDPLAHRDLRPEMMFIREELRQAKWQTLASHFNIGFNYLPARQCRWRSLSCDASHSQTSPVFLVGSPNPPFPPPRGLAGMRDSIFPGVKQKKRV